MQHHHIVHPITEALRHRRIARGLTRSALGKVAGITRNSLQAHEDRKFPALMTLDRWARSLGYQVVLIDTEHK